MPVTHKEVSNGHLLCTAGMIKYCSKNLILKFGGITMKSIFEQNGGTYTKVGDYYIPHISVPNTKEYHIGKYGSLRKTFLRSPLKIRVVRECGRFMLNFYAKNAGILAYCKAFCIKMQREDAVLSCDRNFQR